MRLRGLLEPRGGTHMQGDQGGLSAPSGCTRRFPRAVQLLDAGGFSTAPVAPGRYGFLPRPVGCRSLLVAWWGGGVPGSERAVWLSWDKVEVAGGREGAATAACGAWLRNTICCPLVHCWCLGADVSAGNI